MSKTTLSLLLAGLIASPMQADPLLDKMRSVSSEGPLYVYEMVFDSEEITATGRVDPSQEVGERIEIYSPDESDWSEDFRKNIERIDADVDGDIWCTEFIDAVPDDAERIETTEDAAVFAFTPKPSADSDKTERKLMKQLQGRVTLAKSDGQILAYSMRLPAPYKPAMVAKINRFEMQIACARAPDDRTYTESMQFKIAGSAMMQDFDEGFTRRITKLLSPIE